MTSRDLIEQVDRVGKSMKNNVERACEKSSRIAGVRSVGTSVWIDTTDAQSANDLVMHMRNSGVLVKKNSSKGVMAKPALVLEESQASPLAAALTKF